MNNLNWIFLPDVACIIPVWNRLKIEFIKLDISNWRAIFLIVWLEMKDTDKWKCYDHFRPFFVICMFIFHKTEFQTVILRSLTGLDSDWFKNYDTKCKYFPCLCLLHTSKKMKICTFYFFAFFVISLEPIKI